MVLRNLIVLPRRGPVPPDQPGYERDPGDPYVFYLPWAACPRRTTKPGCGGCSAGGGQPWCDLLEKPVDRVTCHYCEVRDGAAGEEGEAPGGAGEQDER